MNNEWLYSDLADVLSIVVLLMVIIAIGLYILLPDGGEESKQSARRSEEAWTPYLWWKK